MADLDLLRLISGAMAIVQNDLSAKIEREVIAPLTRERDIACARVRELEAECATLRHALGYASAQGDCGFFHEYSAVRR